jgi:lipase (class 3)
MVPDSEIALLSHLIYSGGTGFDHYFPETGFSICCAVLAAPGENIVIFCGTQPAKFQNWLQDLMAYPEPYQHSKFGPIHAGSFCGLPEMMATIVPLINLKLPTTIGGHSLGGQRASEAAAIMLDQYQPDPSLLRLVTMGAPAAGFQQFLTFLSKVSWHPYRNAEGFYGDPVPLLPLGLPPAFAYKNPPFLHVTGAPGGLNEADPIAWHDSLLYANAIAKDGARMS